MPIAYTPEVDALRFNTGVSVPDPRETLKTLKKIIPPHKPLWVDLKCRQLRVASWGDPSFSEVELNREIEVDLPARIIFRGGHSSEISSVEGNKVFLADPPTQCVGKGQSVNILAEKLIVKGPLFTGLDWVYLEACEELGIKHIMASYIQTWEDVSGLMNVVKRDAQIYLKIEDKQGIDNIVCSMTGKHDDLHGMHLELARDDLFTELRGNYALMLEATQQAIIRDKGALVASRLLPSMEHGGEPSLGDLTDIVHLYSFGYRDFMFQDDMSNDAILLRRAAIVMGRCIRCAQGKGWQS
jgi:hypothetical protein